jgi:transcription antitermination factor NusG
LSEAVSVSQRTTQQNKEQVMEWCVVQVRAGQELAAAGLLERSLRLAVFLPEVLQRWHGKTQLGPLFPGYLFVTEGDKPGALGEVDFTPGCGRLVRMGRCEARVSAPVTIEDGVVEQLRLRVAHFNAAGGLPAYWLHPGDWVQIKAGPMQGLEAIFIGPQTPSERVQLLLYFLGREQRVTLALDDVEPCAPPQRRERRTRGHGRRIHCA